MSVKREIYKERKTERERERIDEKEHKLILLPLVIRTGGGGGFSLFFWAENRSESWHDDFIVSSVWLYAFSCYQCETCQCYH